MDVDDRIGWMDGLREEKSVASSESPGGESMVMMAMTIVIVMVGGGWKAGDGASADADASGARGEAAQRGGGGFCEVGQEIWVEVEEMR